MLRRSAAGLTALLLACLPTSAPRAASQGPVGTTSTGQIDLLADVASLIRITGIDDVNFGTWTGGGNRSRTMNHRVCTNAPGRLFSITATGSGPGGTFELANGPSTLGYLLDYRDGTTGWVPLQPNATLSGRVGQAPTGGAVMCPSSGPQPQRLRLRILRPTYQAAPAGTYSGTLALLVAPD